ncbi:MAG: DUF2254 domain-containing protein [Planctomycetaceae bacterium]|nr:DUF2254 domain-containing protein [Planctomycetaceae bacterium]
MEGSTGIKGNVMNWEQRYRMVQTARTSLVLWGVLALLAAMVCAPIVRFIDLQTGWTIFNYTPDGARSLLGTLAGSMLTFIVFVLSATLIVVQLASGQLTPRVIALVLASPGVKVSLGVLTFTFTFTLAALARVEDRVPDLLVSVAVILNLICIIVFFEFVQQLSTGLRPASLMLLVSDRAQDVIEQVYPVIFDPKTPEQGASGACPVAGAHVIEFTGRSGVVMAFGLEHLIRLAQSTDSTIEMLPQVGDSVTRGEPLFRVYGGTRPLPSHSLRACVAVGTERTLDQDPRFAFRILVDIANKALSPAINDPTTGVLAIDQINNLLLSLGRRRLDEGLAYDCDGKLRVVYGTPDWPDYVTLAVSEIRQYGEGSLQVIRRLRAMLEHLIANLPEARWPSLQQELAMLNNAVARKFPDEDDRKRAGIGDYQGVGGSDS